MAKTPWNTIYIHLFKIFNKKKKKQKQTIYIYTYIYIPLNSLNVYLLYLKKMNDNETKFK